MAAYMVICGWPYVHIYDHILVIVISGAAAEAEAEAGLRTGQLKDN